MGNIKTKEKIKLYQKTIHENGIKANREKSEGHVASVFDHLHFAQCFQMNILFVEIYMKMWLRALRAFNPPLFER
jgi:hypothetical protein